MPQRSIDSVRTPCSSMNEPGYEWMKDRFGPPPGIPRKEKERLDSLSDRDYVHEALKMSPNEIESLMASEAERRRSFRSAWTYNDLITGTELAKAGFYYMNAGDRVKCAFCNGIIKQWNKGDSAIARHKRFFGFCQFVQGTARNNIPFDEIGLGDFQVGPARQHQSGIQHNTDALDRLNSIDWNAALRIDLSNQASHPEYVHHHRRLQSFQVPGWPNDLHCLMEKMADAGFYYTGSKDKSVCFFCNGSLEGWEPVDDPWVEHCKWYYKCPFLIQSRGGDFIREVRAGMADESKQHAEKLKYHTGEIQPRTQVDPPLKAERREQKIKQYDEYKYARDMLLDMRLVEYVYKCHNYEQFARSRDLLRLYHKLEDGESLDAPTADDADVADVGEPKEVEPQHPEMSLDLDAIVESGSVKDWDEGQLLVKRLTCRLCMANMCGAVLLPCGCFTLCLDCSRREILPINCPRCHKRVRGTCRAYLM